MTKNTYVQYNNEIYRVIDVSYNKTEGHLATIRSKSEWTIKDVPQSWLIELTKADIQVMIDKYFDEIDRLSYEIEWLSMEDE